ncbi:biglycan-like [Aedes albopictus]|uniref:Uncharacterized protein n=1 Tax=Aedes albopictus TaxID=7160 RepID=A0ABM1ZXT3_AEDAL
MNKVVIMLFFTNALCCIKSLVVQPDPQSNYFNIINFHWPQDAAAIGNFSNYEQIHFINISADIVSRSITNKLENCAWLKLSNGVVGTFYINTLISMIFISNTNTEHVMIETEQDYKLESLIIRRTKLTRVPKRINLLIHIEYLEITGNSIEFVSLDDFNGLNNLYTLDLSNNNIKYIHSTAVSLPKLSLFKMIKNKLYQLDVCSWSMPSINMLALRFNDLKHFAIGHFPTLEYATLQGNPLNCAWRDSFLKLNLNKQWPAMNRLSCDKNSQGNITLHCPSTLDELRQQNSGLQLELNKLREHISSSQRLAGLTKYRQKL